MRVVKGGFAPADNYTVERLRDKHLKLNEIVFAEIKKPRNPKFHRLAHQLGTLVAENIEQFAGHSAHSVLKRLQLEANIRCSEIAYNLPGYGAVIQKVPDSLSYESMDEGQFREVLRAMCRHIAKEYWPTVEPENIERMAGVMVNE